MRWSDYRLINIFVKALDENNFIPDNYPMEKIISMFAKWGSVGGKTRYRRLLKAAKRKAGGKQLVRAAVKPKPLPLPKPPHKKRGPKPGMFAERDQEIARLFTQENRTLESIGAIYGITRERVRQLLVRQGVENTDGSRSKSITGRRISELALRARKQQERMEASCSRYLDCSLHSFTEITGRAWTTWDNAGKLAHAYWEQKHNADFRKIEWELTFQEWVGMWEKSGKLALRGRGQGQYVMGRRNDFGPYSVENCIIIPAVENNSDRKEKKSGLPMGVSKLGNRFRSQKMIDGKKHHIGTFDTPEQAHEAYLKFKGKQQ